MRIIPHESVRGGVSATMTCPCLCRSHSIAQASTKSMHCSGRKWPPMSLPNPDIGGGRKRTIMRAYTIYAAEAILSGLLHQP